MTPIALVYLILGLTILVWPLSTLLFKRTVMAAQWLFMAALFLFSISMILYSCFFNTFLRGEYLLVVMFMSFSLCAAPTALLGVVSLTRTEGVPRIARIAFVPALVTIVLLAASVVIAGPDAYRLWIDRGTDAHAGDFFQNSWRYNLIVVFHYYLFWFVSILQILILALFSIFNLKRYNQLMREYYHPGGDMVTHRYRYMVIIIISIFLLFSLVFYPFNVSRPLWIVIAFCIVEAIATAVLGYSVYILTLGAETIGEQIRRTPQHARGDLQQLARDLSAYVEKEGCLDPDLSVFSLAARFRCSQDQVVDAIHRLRGLSFADYIDSLRVERAAAMLFNGSESEDLTRIAHRCGYLDAAALRQAYRKVMHTEIDNN